VWFFVVLFILDDTPIFRSKSFGSLSPILYVKQDLNFGFHFFCLPGLAAN